MADANGDSAAAATGTGSISSPRVVGSSSNNNGKGAPVPLRTSGSSHRLHAAAAANNGELTMADYLICGGTSYVPGKQIQWSPDLTNRWRPSQLFVKPGYALNPKFL